MNILIVLAHPDDEAFGLGGTIKLLSQSGHRVVLINTTTGGAGEVHPSLQKKIKQLGSIEKMRARELQAATRILGIAQIYVFPYGDGKLNNSLIFSNKLVRRIKKLIIKEKAELVLAYDHTGISWHLDHIATSIATAKACYELGSVIDKLFLLVRPKKLNLNHYSYLVRVTNKSDYYVDISPVAETKRKAIMVHQSQRSDWERFLNNPHNQIAFKKEYFQKAIDNHKSDEIFALFKKIEDQAP